jgi:Tol biopolymer transport system component
MDVDAGESSVQRLASSDNLNWEPAWSPDGAWIAFGSLRNNNSDIYLMSARIGGDERRLTTQRQVDGYACWSPDSSQLAFVSDRDGNWEIYVMLVPEPQAQVNAGGSNVRRLTRNDADDWDPDWSPDGTQIAFASRRDGNIEIYVVNADGSDLRRLTDHPADDMSPSWSPDGTRIAFHREEGGHAGIYVMNADGSNLHKLTTDSNNASNPVWRPKTNAPVSPTPTSAPISGVISVDTAGQVKLLSTLSGHSDRVVALAFSGDGSHIASSSMDKTIRLWDVRSGQEVCAFSINEVEINSIAFSPDGTLIASGGYDQQIYLWGVPR